MNLLSIFLISFTIALSGAMMPGPLLTAVISESLKHGKKSGPLISLGHALLEILMVLIILFSFNQFVHNPNVLKPIALVGAVMLFYSGIKMILALTELELEFNSEEAADSSGLVLTGITMSVSNPYWTIWWLTIGLGLVLSARQVGWLAVGVFFLGHILADFVWYTAVSNIVSRGRNYLSMNLYRGVMLVCALVLIGFALYFGWSAFAL